MAHQELRNEPPDDIAHQQPQIPSLTSLLLGSGVGWSERDFGVVGKLCHVEADFEALDALIFMAPAVLPCIFLCPSIAQSNFNASVILQ